MTNAQTEARAIAHDVFHNAVDSDDGSESMDMPVAIDIIATALSERDATIAGLSKELVDAKAEVARYWTSADIKPWCDLAEEKGLGHFGKKLKGMFSRAMAAEEEARRECERAERAESSLAEREAEMGREWQPIETAPKDGSHIILQTADGFVCEGKWSPRFAEHAYPVTEAGWYSFALDRRIENIVEWMPLPIPTRAATRTGGPHG